MRQRPGPSGQRRTSQRKAKVKTARMYQSSRFSISERPHSAGWFLYTWLRAVWLVDKKTTSVQMPKTPMASRTGLCRVRDCQSAPTAIGLGEISERFAVKLELSIDGRRSYV